MHRLNRSYLEFWIVFCTSQLRAWSSFLNPLRPHILQLRPEVLVDDLVPDLDIKGVGHLNKHVRIPRVHWDDVKFSVEFVPCRARLLLGRTCHARLISVLASDNILVDIGLVPRDELPVDGPLHFLTGH